MKPLFGPDGRPLMLVGTDAEKQEDLTKAILIECFGAIAGITPMNEWTKLEGGIEAGATRLLDAIVDRVGREPLVERFKAYGVRFETPEDATAPPTEPRAPNVHCGHCARLYPCDVDGPCGEHDTEPRVPGYQPVGGAMTAEEMARAKDAQAKGHSNPKNPYRKVLGWPTRES